MQYKYYGLIREFTIVAVPLDAFHTLLWFMADWTVAYYEENKFIVDPAYHRI